jgi:hypothetical protein
MVLEHATNDTYPLHVRDDISLGMIWYRARAVVLHQESQCVDRWPDPRFGSMVRRTRTR